MTANLTVRLHGYFWFKTGLAKRTHLSPLIIHQKYFFMLTLNSHICSNFHVFRVSQHTDSFIPRILSIQKVSIRVLSVYKPFHSGYSEKLIVMMNNIGKIRCFICVCIVSFCVFSEYRQVHSAYCHYMSISLRTLSLYVQFLSQYYLQTLSFS